MNTERTYPYKAWTLQPSFKPIEVELVKPYYGENWDESATGKGYLVAELFPTKAAAIGHGWTRIADMQADLDKRAENLQKKRAALTKAAQ